MSSTDLHNIGNESTKSQGIVPVSREFCERYIKFHESVKNKKEKEWTESEINEFDDLIKILNSNPQFGITVRKMK